MPSASWRSEGVPQQPTPTPDGTEATLDWRVSLPALLGVLCVLARSSRRAARSDVSTALAPSSTIAPNVKVGANSSRGAEPKANAGNAARPNAEDDDADPPPPDADEEEVDRSIDAGAPSDPDSGGLLYISLSGPEALVWIPPGESVSVGLVTDQPVDAFVNDRIVQVIDRKAYGDGIEFPECSPSLAHEIRDGKIFLHAHNRGTSGKYLHDGVAACRFQQFAVGHPMGKMLPVAATPNPVFSVGPGGRSCEAPQQQPAASTSARPNQALEGSHLRHLPDLQFVTDHLGKGDACAVALVCRHFYRALDLSNLLSPKRYPEAKRVRLSALNLMMSDDDRDSHIRSALQQHQEPSHQGPQPTGRDGPTPYLILSRQFLAKHYRHGMTASDARDTLRERRRDWRIRIGALHLAQHEPNRATRVARIERPRREPPLACATDAKPIIDPSVYPLTAWYRENIAAVSRQLIIDASESVAPLAAWNRGLIAAVSHQQLALTNYEDFHRLPLGSTTYSQVNNSSAGIDGWAAFDPTIISEGGRGISTSEIHSCTDAGGTKEQPATMPQVGGFRGGSLDRALLHARASGRAGGSKQQPAATPQASGIQGSSPDGSLLHVRKSGLPQYVRKCALPCSRNITGCPHYARWWDASKLARLYRTPPPETCFECFDEGVPRFTRSYFTPPPANCTECFNCSGGKPASRCVNVHTRAGATCGEWQCSGCHYESHELCECDDVDSGSEAEPHVDSGFEAELHAQRAPSPALAYLAQRVDSDSETKPHTQEVPSPVEPPVSSPVQLAPPRVDPWQGWQYAGRHLGSHGPSTRGEDGIGPSLQAGDPCPECPFGGTLLPACECSTAPYSCRSLECSLYACPYRTLKCVCERRHLRPSPETLVTLLGGAAVLTSSKPQHFIPMSSTEADSFEPAEDRLSGSPFELLGAYHQAEQTASDRLFVRSPPGLGDSHGWGEGVGCGWVTQGVRTQASDRQGSRAPGGDGCEGQPARGRGKCTGSGSGGSGGGGPPRNPDGPSSSGFSSDGSPSQLCHVCGLHYDLECATCLSWTCPNVMGGCPGLGETCSCSDVESQAAKTESRRQQKRARKAATQELRRSGYSSWDAPGGSSRPAYPIPAEAFGPSSSSTSLAAAYSAGSSSNGIVRSFRESVVAANARDAAFRQSASLVPIALAPSAPPPGSGWAGTPPDGVAHTFRESVETVNAARQRSSEPAPITPVSRSVTPVFGSSPAT